RAFSGHPVVVNQDQGEATEHGPFPADLYLAMRDGQIAKYRGVPWKTSYNARVRAFNRMRAQQRALAFQDSPHIATPTWTEIGPAPIQNGQTSPISPLSGRVTAIS